MNMLKCLSVCKERWQYNKIFPIQHPFEVTCRKGLTVILNAFPLL